MKNSERPRWEGVCDKATEVFVCLEEEKGNTGPEKS